MFKFYTTPSIEIINNLIGNQPTIKLSSVFNLNDPYELQFNLDLDPTAKEHEANYFKVYPDNNITDFKKWQKHALEHNGYTWYLEMQLRNSVAQSIGLCSFTEINSNNLMWSHYTNNHKGICIEYKPELIEYLKSMKNFIAKNKVTYSSEPPIVNELENEILKFSKILFNKQIDWKYEREIRVVFYSEQNTEYIPIDIKYIKSVYIGSRTENAIEKEIISLCKKSDIDIYLGITVGKTYDVHFEEYKEGTYYARSTWK